MRFLIAAVSIAISAWGLDVVRNSFEPMFGGPPPNIIGITPHTVMIIGTGGLVMGLAWTLLFLVDPRRAGDLVPTIRSSQTGPVAIAMSVAGCVGVAAALVLPSLGWPVHLLGLLGIIGIALSWSGSVLVAAWEPRPTD